MDDEDTLYHWARRYVSSCDYQDEHSSAAHDAAELEYCEDNMRRHLSRDPRLADLTPDDVAAIFNFTKRYALRRGHGISAHAWEVLSR